MRKIEPRDIDDDLFTYFENTGEYPIDWEQVALFDEETNLAVVSVDGIYGAINRQGEIVIPLVYDYAMIKFSEGLLGVKKNNKWGYIDTNHEIVIPFEYDNIADYKFENGEYWMKNDSILGIADDFRGNKVFVCKNRKIGLINNKNEILFPFIYKDISSCNEKYLTVSFDKLKYGLVDFTNKNVLPFNYDLLNINGDYLNFAELSEVTVESYDSGVNFTIVRENKLIKHGIMDFAGNIIVPAISGSEIRNFIDGKAMCYDYEKQEFFIYDTDSNEIIFAPEDLIENESETNKVNYIREKMGMEPVVY